MSAPTIPIDLSNTHHKHGGQITRISGIAHTCDKPQAGRSRDFSYFVGDVTWADGSKSTGIEIAPHAVCYVDDAHRDEVLALMAELSAYLETHGQWFHSKPHEGWYANVRLGAPRRMGA